MFTNAKEVRINNKIVKSIKTVGDNMTLYINAYLKSGDLTLLTDKDIIQAGEISNLQALLNTGEGGVRVDFFEVLTPAINLTVDKNIIQVGERVNLTTKLKDADGSIVQESGLPVKLYKQTSTIEDDLTTDTGLFELSNSNATVTYGGDGMTFRQTTSNESTILKSTFGLDLANYSYDMEFKLVNYTTGDNTPLRFKLYDEDGVSSSWAMLVNRTVGYLFCGTSWTKNTNHNISNGTVFKIHFEDGNHKLYKNGELVASSSMVYGKIMYIGWLQWQGYYFTITDFKMEEI